MAGGFPHDPGMAKRLFFQLDDTAGDQHFPYVEDIADIADASPGHHEPRFGPAHDTVARQADPGQGLIKAGLRGKRQQAHAFLPQTHVHDTSNSHYVRHSRSAPKRSGSSGGRAMPGPPGKKDTQNPWQGSCRSPVPDTGSGLLPPAPPPHEAGDPSG